MEDLSRKGRVTSALDDYAARAVPEAPGLWAGIEGALRQRELKSGRATRSHGRRGPLPRSRAVFGGALLALGLLVGLSLLAGGLWRTTPVAAAEVLRKAGAAASFVPTGKVRHIVTRYDFGQAQGWTQDLWLANGRAHLLLWKAPAQPIGANPLPAFLAGTARLVDEQSIWDFRLDQGTVYKQMYDIPGRPDPVAPELPSHSVIDEMLTRPNTHIASTGKLDGRDVIIVAGHVGTVVSGSPLEIAVGKLPGYLTAQHDFQLWIDSKTYQVVQEQHYIRSDGPEAAAGTVYTTTTRIVRDELLDADAQTMSVFQFRLPEGAQIVDMASMPAPTPEPQHTGWYTYSSPEARFEILMPRRPERGGSSGPQGNTMMVGVKQDGVSYVVRYRDYPADLIEREGAAGWLDLERDDVLAQSQGTLKTAQQLTLQGYPGQEIRSVDPDGRFRITRLFLARNRLYILTVITANEQAVPGDVQRFLESFRILQP